MKRLDDPPLPVQPTPIAKPYGVKGYVYCRVRNGERSEWTPYVPDFQVGDTILCRKDDGR